MSITKLTQAYNEILSGYALSQDVSPLFYYNKDKGMIDSVLEDKMLPTFYAKYNSTGDVAIVLRINLRGSYDCFLFGKPDEKIVLTEVSSGESIKYYRDDQDVHYVPKRKLEDIVIRANAEKYDK